MELKYEKSPHRKLTEPKTGSVHWTDGFWAEKFKLCHNVIIPNMRNALDDPENSAYMGNFYIAAGLKEGNHRGTFWSDGDCYKWMEAVSHVIGITGDSDLDQALDELIEVIAKAQDEDGYICTQIQLTDKGRWTVRSHHELYNMGHLMTAACVHHRVTGKDGFLNVAKKLADYLYNLFQPRPRELAHYGWNPSNIMGLVDLYRTTGDPRYLELAGVFVDMRGSASGDFKWNNEYMLRSGGDQNQDRVPLRKETDAVGHAVTATYLYCGATDVYMETGDQALLGGLERIWKDIVERKMYITGGVGPLHNGVSKRGDAVHEAFDLAYHLHNASGYNETCADIGNGMWNWRLLSITGDARYADVMEQVIYNTGLSGVSIDGTRFCYTNPLRWHGEKHELLSQDSQQRWVTSRCYCCPPQVTRMIAWMQNWAYGLSDEGIWVNIYGGNVLDTMLNDGSPIKLTQGTQYPWDGEIKITVEKAPEKPLAIMLRIPGWTDGASIKINGEALDMESKAGTYATLERTWSAGDTIYLSLPMKARLMIAHPRVEEARNHLAIMRGPLVYCLESVDLPEGVHISEVYIPRNIQLTAKYEENLLGGMAVLKGEACHIHSQNQQNSLYRIIGDTAIKPVEVTLIPYYAWNNRGTTEMTVWLPLC